MRLTASGLCLGSLLAAGCGTPPSPVSPTATVTSIVETVVLEAEAGGGDGDLMHRSHASGAMTIHLAPGQRRRWTFSLRSQPSPYAVVVTYSNDNPGATEVLHVEVDGQPIGTLQAQDTGDDGEGWEVFVAERAGVITLGAGAHSVTVESTGGDGCIEIDMVTLRPAG